MRLFVAVTDLEWYRLHAASVNIEEVNFWRPSAEANFKALGPGDMLLFKLHAPDNAIAGGGFFARFIRLPLSLAWQAFGQANGVVSREDMRRRIGKYRRQLIAEHEDPTIGCILLEEPFFFPPRDWIAAPADFKLNTVVGKGYDTGDVMGSALYQAVGERLGRLHPERAYPSPAIAAVADGARFGKPALVSPRLGQGSFRVLVAENYGRRCAITGERTLPVLQASHIRPYGAGGEHRLDNGLLLRSDVHTLFDLGYLTVDPDSRQIVVSHRIREEFENGRAYYALDGRPLAQPAEPAYAPARENLLFHAQNVFRP